MQLVSWFSANTAPKIVPPETKVEVDGKRQGLVEMLIQIVKANAQFWEKASLQQLRWMRNVCLRSNLSSSHDFMKKIDQAAQKCSKVAQNQFSPGCVNPLEANERKRMMLAPPVKAQADTKFVQNNMTLEQATAFINENGAQLTEIELNQVNNALMKLVAEKCPNVTSFALTGGSLNFGMEHLTDEGFACIGQLTKLTKLNLGVWGYLHVTTDGLQKVLSTPQFLSNLQELNLYTFLANNDVLNIVAKYAQLSKLSVTTASISPAGTEPLLQSPTLKASLQSLQLAMGDCWGTLVTDNVLKSLSAYPKLSELSLNGKWVVADQNLQNLLQAKPSLTKLELSGISISQAVAAKIGAMTAVQDLLLGDCSLLGENDYNALLQTKPSLTTLNLANTLWFTDNNMAAVTALNQLSSLALQNCSYLYQGLNTLTSSQTMQDNLRSLYLSGATAVPSLSYSHMGKLAGLTTLRLESCPQFNDDSLRVILRSPLKDSIIALELNAVSIGNAQLRNLIDFNKLQILMLANCYGITKEETALFLRSPTLHQKLLKFFIAGAVITDEMVKEFNGFEKLQVLLVENPQGLSFSHQDALFRQPNLKKLNTFVVLSFGELDSYTSFLEAS